jgi:hypothetical protein
MIAVCLIVEKVSKVVFLQFWSSLLSAQVTQSAYHQGIPKHSSASKYEFSNYIENESLMVDNVVPLPLHVLKTCAHHVVLLKDGPRLT